MIGFPELRARVHKVEVGRTNAGPAQEAPTIEAFAADAAGAPLAVRVEKGRGDYRRWFEFSTPFAEKSSLAVRNLYVARPGQESSRIEGGVERFGRDVVDGWIEYRVEYVLHTGSSWAGPIGSGEVGIWDGGWRKLNAFSSLKPTRRDDVTAIVRVPPGWVTLEPAAVVRASSSYAPDRLSHIAPMVLDRDPQTTWTDGGKKGGIGEWVQVPTHALPRFRGLVIDQGGTPAPGTARIKRLDLTCFDFQGSAGAQIFRPQRRDVVGPVGLESAPLQLADRPSPQRLILPRPLGECYAVRLTIRELYGPANRHGSIAELSFIH